MLSSLLGGAFSIFLSVLVMGLGWVLSKTSVSDREKSSPFECGFDPMNTARIPFSMRFFLLAIIFLIFDIEIVLLFPILISLKSGLSNVILLGSSMFLIILLVGILHEWNEGSLDWAQ